MVISFLLIVPLLGLLNVCNTKAILYQSSDPFNLNSKIAKAFCLIPFLINLFLIFGLFIAFDLSLNQYQFVQEYYKIGGFHLYLGIDGLSIYFILLTAIIMPIALISNWISIIFKHKSVKIYIIVILLLETLLFTIFLALDMFCYYIYFESILIPLFILIGLFGSNEKVKASFYIFLYTLMGSLFLLLSILTILCLTGTTDYNTIFKINLNYDIQCYIFLGIFIAFAVKTPTIFLNSWLLKAHVESPLGGSIILAGIVLKLSLYGILRLILPILTQATFNFIFLIYLIGVITIFYASVSTIRTIDVKELIAYSSVCHAAVYLMSVFSNSITGIQGSIILGLAHGFVSSGLFVCVGGVLYDRSHTRIISLYRGMAQIMPIFSIMFFILCLSNCGVPLSLNFVGEFMSLYGIFERLPLLGVFASFSIILSACYTILMFNRISFGGSYSEYFFFNIADVNKREFVILFTLTIITIVFGIYPTPILQGLNYETSTLLYSSYF